MLISWCTFYKHETPLSTNSHKRLLWRQDFLLSLLNIVLSFVRCWIKCRGMSKRTGTVESAIKSWKFNYLCNLIVKLCVCAYFYHWIRWWNLKTVNILTKRFSNRIGETRPLFWVDVRTLSSLFVNYFFFLFFISYFFRLSL